VISENSHNFHVAQDAAGIIAEAIDDSR